MISYPIIIETIFFSLKAIFFLSFWMFLVSVGVGAVHFHSFFFGSFLLFYFHIFLTSTLPLADPFGTFLKRRLGAPQGGQLQLLGRAAHLAGPCVKT